MRSGEPVVTNSRVFYFPREAAGATDTRLSLRPLLIRGGRIVHNSGAVRAAGTLGVDLVQVPSR